MSVLSTGLLLVVVEVVSGCVGFFLDASSDSASDSVSSDSELVSVSSSSSSSSLVAVVGGGGVVVAAAACLLARKRLWKRGAGAVSEPADDRRARGVEAPLLSLAVLLGVAVAGVDVAGVVPVPEDDSEDVLESVLADRAAFLSGVAFR